MQMKYLTDLLCENYNEITQFFKDVNYDLKIIDLRKFIIEKHPELYG